MGSLIFNIISVLLGFVFIGGWLSELKEAYRVGEGRFRSWIATPQWRGFAYFIAILTLPWLFVQYSNLGGWISEVMDYRYALLWASIFVALLISFGWAYYLRALDIFERERTAAMLVTFALGCASTMLLWPIGDRLFDETGWVLNGSLWNDWWYCVIRIGLLEEVVKIVPFLLVLLVTRQVNEPFDYVLYGSLSALGFAFIENVTYLQSTGLNAVFGRALYSSVAHMFDTSVVCYTIVLANYKRHRWRWLALPAGLVLASLAHGFYDFWLISEPVKGLSIITSIFLIGTLQLWVIMKNNLLNISPFFNVNVKLNSGRFKYLVINIMLTALAVAYLWKFLLSAPDKANALYLNSLVIYAYVLLFVSLSFGNMEIVPQYLQRVSIPWNVMEFFIPRMESQSNISGSRVVLAVPENAVEESGRRWVDYTGKVNGTLVRRIVIRGFTNWYLFVPDDEAFKRNYQAYAVRADDASNQLNGKNYTLSVVYGVEDTSKISDGVLRRRHAVPEGLALMKAE